MLRTKSSGSDAGTPELRLVSLGSGSSGNAFYIAFGETRILIDTGFSASETVRRMRFKELDPSKLNAILITHEHVDHVRGIAVFSRRHGVPVYIAPAAYKAYLKFGKPVENRVEFKPGRSLSIGDLEVFSFSVPHDAADPVGFRIHAGPYCLGIATDLGYVPEEVVEHLRDGDILVLESNHDVDMLKKGPYPWVLKQRILGRSGHLSNESLSFTLPEVITEKCRALVPAHISKINNRPEMAKLSCEIALSKLGLDSVRVIPADQDCPVVVWGQDCSCG